MTALNKYKGLPFHVVVLGTVIAFFVTFVLPHPAHADGKVTIPVGTRVQLVTIQEILPINVNIGDTVELTVASDVVVNGQVVIRSGAPAKAEITQAKENNFIGIAAKIGLSARSVQAVDGTTVMISGTKLSEGKDKMAMSIGLALVCCILFALVKGGPASVPSGTVIECTVASTTDVKV
jgi:hypothetical protein